MENWFFLFLGLLLAYLLEFTRPWVKSYFEKSSLTVKQRRIYVLVEHYKHIKQLKENPAYLNLIGFRKIAWGIAVIVLEIGMVGLFIMVKIIQLKANSPDIKSLTDPLFLVLVVFPSSYLALRLTTDINEALDFERYKEKTITKLKKLDGNLEDLDKEDG